MAPYEKRYNPDRSPEWNYGGAKWKLSRSKIDSFLECPRCFYLDNKLGTKRPSTPPFTLNVAVDTLFKREFDRYRETQQPHPLMEQYKITAVPFAHPQLENWRDPFVGIEYTHPATGLRLSGGVDDIWVSGNGELLVVDYKATSKPGHLTTLDDSSWAEQYARQISVYQWLLRQNGFPVSTTGYFVYANADDSHTDFADTLHFETTIIPTEGSTDWIEPLLPQIKAALESDTYPDNGPRCEYCAYREACGKKLRAIYTGKQK